MAASIKAKFNNLDGKTCEYRPMIQYTKTPVNKIIKL